MNLTKAEPAEFDRMPKEVATALLTEPKAKLSNRMRKTIRLAREKVFVSTSPIVAIADREHASTGKREKLVFYYTDIEKQDPEVKIEHRSKRATWAQLVKWQRRTVARRAVVQKKYEAHSKLLDELNEIGDPSTVQVHAIRKVTMRLVFLSALAKQLDNAWGVFDDEIKRRKGGEKS